ncbi:MAG: NAD-dependent epimerase/dehydratase family protein [Chitinophagaceae bacterium]|nr:NAD-dependent epimerase/dehydratase family protein [Chitinophagaceae bacterium]
MKIFITGATGYVGNQLARQLMQQGKELNLLVRDPGSVNLPAGKNVTIFKGDITDEESVARAIKDCRYVYHCAAIAKLNTSDKNIFYDVNVTGTRNIMEAALHANVQKMVFTSSAAVFGPSLNIPLTENDPRIESFESDYDFSKHMAENLVREFVNKGLNAVIVNPSRVYGPGPATYSNAVTRMIQYLLTKKILFFPKIDDYRTNYCYINDVVNGHILAMEKGVAGENYILGGENISYGELLKTVTQQTATKNRIVRMPIGLVKGIAFLSQLINRNTELTPSLITRFAKNRMLNSEKAMNCLGYQVTSFNEGIQHTIDFLKHTKS